MDVIAGREALLSAFRLGEGCTQVLARNPDVLKMLQRAYPSHVVVCMHTHMHGFMEKAIISRWICKTTTLLKKYNNRYPTYLSISNTISHW